MKKVVLTLGLLGLVLAPSFAQTIEQPAEEQKGNYLGVDNDEKEYLIGAPADNWWIGVGAGVQTYIDNQIENSARWNPITPAFNLEIGKWLIPDVAVSLQFTGFNSVSQTRYKRNPWADFSGMSVDKFGHFPYQQIHHLTMALNGYVTLDWTNMCIGYERGSAKKVHILTPIGLGVAAVTGKNINPDAKDMEQSHELSFGAAFIPMITLSENIRLVPAIRLLMARGTLNLGPYNDEPRTCLFDFMPSVTLGLNFNLSGTKEGATHKTKYHGDVATNHVFIPVENSYTMKVIYDKIAALKADNDDLKNQLAAVPAPVPVPVALAADQKAVDDGAAKRPLSAMEEILLNTDDAGSVLVYFDINSSKLDLNAQRRIENFAAYIKNSAPETKFYIIGAADSATGNEKINNDLSNRRCKAVYDKLVKECGISPAKLELKPLGGIAEYGENYLNRLGLCAESTSNLTSIVDKWSK